MGSLLYYWSECSIGTILEKSEETSRIIEDIHPMTQQYLSQRQTLKKCTSVCGIVI